MLRNKRIFAILMMSVLFVGNIFAQASSANLADRYLQRAEEALDKEDVSEAYKNVNNAIKVSKTSESEIIPTNVLITARTVYRAKIKKLLEKYNEQELLDVKSNLEQYPEVNTTEITKLIKQIEAKEQERRARAAERSQQQLVHNLSENSTSTAKALNELAEGLKKNSEISQSQAETTRELMELTREQNEVTGNRIRNIFFLIILIVAIILVIVLVIIIVVGVSAKHSQIQQAQYVEAFKLLAANQTQTNQLMIGGIAGIYGDDGLKLAGSSSTWSQDSLPPPEETPEEKEELRELAAKCEDLGAKIDQITGRKNNSKNVSELVYKIALKLGMNQHDALIYFCAGMIYDAGFLGIEPTIMTSETLNQSQRDELNRHVDLAEDYLQFVPKRYWDVFISAAHSHHENMDGSGMPKGLKGEEIPKIARIIRVVDSYIALTSRRSYREGTDKEAAYELLQERAEIYDKDVIAALGAII